MSTHAAAAASPVRSSAVAARPVPSPWSPTGPGAHCFINQTVDRNTRRTGSTPRSLTYTIANVHPRRSTVPRQPLYEPPTTRTAPPTRKPRSFNDPSGISKRRFRGPLHNALAHTTLHQSHGRPIIYSTYTILAVRLVSTPHCPRYDPAITLTGISSVPLNIFHFFVSQATLTTH